MAQMSMLPIAVLCLTALLSTVNATVQDAASQSRDKTEQHSDVNGATSPELLHPATSNDGPSARNLDSDHQNDDVAAGIVDRADGDVAKRAMGMLRLGRAGSRQPSDRRAMSALRLGRRNSWAPAGSGSRNPVTGESAADVGSVAEVEKRKSMSMLRLGRAQVDQPASEFKDEEKKAMSALRLGRKRGSGDEDFANGEMSQLSEDMSEPVDVDAKRAMSMLRLGRNSDADESDLENVLATPNDDEKRAMGMLRLGRQSIASPSRIDRRKSMAMLRLG